MAEADKNGVEVPLTTDAHRGTARSLILDRMTAEVCAAFTAAGVPSRLLKGPAVARWLYDADENRVYGDTDLLVPPAGVPRAESTLVELGFAMKRPDLSPREETAHGRVWARQGLSVDLHQTLWGVGVPATEAWTRLSAEVEELSVGGRRVEVLATPARALHVALHAAQHGTGERKPLEDLARAGARVPLETWRRAAALAHELDATGAMAAGLRLHPQTASLADELGLPSTASLAVRLYASGARPRALGVARVLAAEGTMNKAAMAVRRLVPTPAKLRANYPGPLLGAYIRRTASLVRDAPSVLLEVGRAMYRGGRR